MSATNKILKKILSTKDINVVQMKIVLFLAVNKDSEYTRGEIANNLDMGSYIVGVSIANLEETEFITFDIVGGIKIYRVIL